MPKENSGMKVRDADGTYRFQSRKCTVTLKFAEEETAPTIEDILEKILIERMQ